MINLIGTITVKLSVDPEMYDHKHPQVISYILSEELKNNPAAILDHPAVEDITTAIKPERAKRKDAGTAAGTTVAADEIDDEDDE